MSLEIIQWHYQTRSSCFDQWWQNITCARIPHFLGVCARSIFSVGWGIYFKQLCLYCALVYSFTLPFFTMVDMWCSVYYIGTNEIPRFFHGRKFLTGWDWSSQLIDLFTVECLVTRPLNESEVGSDLVMIETSLLLLCKFILISMRTASLTQKKQGGFYQTRSPPASLSFRGQATKLTTVNWSIDNLDIFTRERQDCIFTGMKFSSLEMSVCI